MLTQDLIPRSPKAPIFDLQYVKFVTIMVGRIRAGESDVQEVKLFFELLTTDHEGDAFWTPIEKLMPEVTLKEFVPLQLSPSLTFSAPTSTSEMLTKQRRAAPKVEDENPPLQLLYELLYTELAERNEARKEDWAEAQYQAKRGMVPRDRSISPECDTWLGASGRDKLKNSLFGENTYVAPGSRQDRMLRSWMEIGYPKRAQGEEPLESDLEEPEDA